MVMIGRKALMLESDPKRHLHIDEYLFEIPHLEAIKIGATENFKKYGYATLVVTLKMYVKSANLLKRQYEELQKKLVSFKNKGKNISELEMQMQKKQVSKFLEMISDYKHKIRTIKHRIAEEEDKNM